MTTVTRKADKVLELHLCPWDANSNEYSFLLVTGEFEHVTITTSSLPKHEAELSYSE